MAYASGRFMVNFLSPFMADLWTTARQYLSAIPSSPFLATLWDRPQIDVKASASASATLPLYMAHNLQKLTVLPRRIQTARLLWCATLPINHGGKGRDQLFCFRFIFRKPSAFFRYAGRTAAKKLLPRYLPQTFRFLPHCRPDCMWRH